MIISSNNSSPTRRDFVHSITLLATGGIATTAYTQEEKKKEEESKVPDLKAYSEAMETIVRFRLGKILQEPQLKRVIGSVAGRRNSADALKKYPVLNSDDPAEAFRADFE
jgi:hypothetical protein